MKKFNKTYIEITNVCNLFCDFCPKTSRKAQFMNEVQFEYILNKLKGVSKTLYFHVMGEPLNHPQVDLFLDLCDKYEYKVIITTNGTLLDKVGYKLLSKPSLKQINISLHSFEANGSTNTIDDYLLGIFNFINKIKDSQWTKVSLRMWNIPKDKEYGENEYLIKRIIKEFNINEDYQNIMKLNSYKLYNNVFLNQSYRFDWPDLKIEHISDKGFCYGLRDQIGILVDGSVIPCCLDAEGSINLGNIFVNDLEEIIQGSRARDIYDGFSQRKVIEELCSKCGYRHKFDY